MQAQLIDWIEDVQPIVKFQQDYYVLLSSTGYAEKLWSQEVFDTLDAAREAATAMTRWLTPTYGCDESTGQVFRIATDWTTSTMHVPEGHHIERRFTAHGWFISEVVRDE